MIDAKVNAEMPKTRFIVVSEVKDDWSWERYVDGLGLGKKTALGNAVVSKLA